MGKGRHLCVVVSIIITVSHSDPDYCVKYALDSTYCSILPILLLPLILTLLLLLLLLLLLPNLLTLLHLPHSITLHMLIFRFVLPSRTIPREDKYVHDISDLANMFLDCLKTLLARSARTSTPVIVAHKNKDKDKDKDTNNAEATVSLSKQQLQNQSNDGKEQPNEPQFPTNVPIVLLGHSLGGMLAYEVARRWGTVPLFSTIGKNYAL